MPALFSILIDMASCWPEKKLVTDLGEALFQLRPFFKNPQKIAEAFDVLVHIFYCAGAISRMEETINLALTLPLLASEEFQASKLILHYNLAVSQSLQCKFEEALRNYKQAFNLRKILPSVEIQYIDLLCELKRFEEALEACKLCASKTVAENYSALCTRPERRNNLGRTAKNSPFIRGWG